MSWARSLSMEAQSRLPWWVGVCHLEAQQSIEGDRPLHLDQVDERDQVGDPRAHGSNGWFVRREGGRRASAAAEPRRDRAHAKLRADGRTKHGGEAPP